MVYDWTQTLRYQVHLSVAKTIQVLDMESITADAVSTEVLGRIHIERSACSKVLHERASTHYGC